MNMKKKLLLLLSVLLMTVFAVSACSSYPSTGVEVTPDSKYAVTSNGGTAVQVGDVIYFVNGYKDITDTDATNNKFGEVVKGGIFAAKIKNGTEIDIQDDYYSQNGKAYKTYTVDNLDISEEITGFDMAEAEYKDDAGATVKEKYIVNSRIVPKLITSTGNGSVQGIYVIDGYIYYTTPNNLKNRKGEVQYQLFDFMRTSLDGKVTQLLYTSKSTSTKPSYGYYYYDGETYLTVYEGGLDDKPIYSIKAGAKKVNKAKKIAENVISVVFSAKEVFHKDMSQNMTEDYIYYTVADEINENRNKVIMMRPTGLEDGLEIFTGTSFTLDKVSEGFLLYSYTEKSNSYYAATDLATERQAETEPYTFYYPNGTSSSPNYSNIYGIVKAKYSYIDTIQSNQYELTMIANDTSGNLYYVVSSGIDFKKILTGKSINVMAIDGDYLYYTEKAAASTDGSTTAATDAVLKKINYTVAEGTENVEFALANNISTALISKVDIAGGYLFYISTESGIAGYAETTVNYTKIVRVSKSGEAAKGIEWDINTVEENDLPEEDETETTAS